MLQPTVHHRWPLLARWKSAVQGSGAMTLVDQGVFSLTNLIWIRQLGRTLSLDRLGDYYCLLSFVLLLMNAQAQLLTAPYSVKCHAKQSEDELRAYTHAVFTHEWIVMWLTAGLFGIAFMVAWLIDWPSRMALAALCLTAPCYLARIFLRYISFARSKHVIAVLLDLAVGVVQLTGLWFLVTTDRINLANAFLVLGLSCGIVVPFWLRWSGVRWRAGASAPVDLTATWRENWSFGKWALLSFAVGGVLSHVFPVLVAAFADRTQAGLLGACTTLSGFATMFVVGLANALTPAAARAYQQQGNTALLRVLTRNALIMGSAVGGFLLATIVGGEWILTELIYNQRFAGQGPTLAWLVAGVLGLAASVIFGNGLWAIDRPKLNLHADIVTLVVTLTLAVSLIRPWGALGAAMSICLGNAAGAAVRAAVFRWALRRTSMHPAATS